MEPQAVADVLGRLARGEKVSSYLARVRARDGSVKQVLIDGRGLFQEGHLVHSRCFTRDVTGFLEREQSARHRVEETSHLKDDFMALLSHELRAPLGTILIWLGLLRQDASDPALGDRALEIMERSARTLERIIEDMLHASRIAAGGLTLSRHLVDLRGLVQAAVDAAAGDAAICDLQLAWPTGGQPVWVMGDPGRLQQVVSNLLSNAIKFTPAGGRVEVDLDTSEAQARLRITDTGEGISPGFLPFAFDRFRQEDTSSTRVHHGLGLGLYVVHHVIAHHGGLVHAQSPGPGLGSTFTVSIPLATREQVGAPSAAEPGGKDAPLSPGLSVLVVDDEEDVREALTLILRQNGILVTSASSAAEAFEAIERLRPDILLSDIAMPGEDGLTLIRRVRLLPPNRGGRTPAVALSAYASTDDRRKALLAGFQHHIAKPVDPAHLLTVLSRMARISVREDR